MLRLVPRAHSRAPRAPFMVLVLALLGGALVALLLLTTSMEQGAFRLQALQHAQAQLLDQEQSLQGRVQADAAPGALAARAQALGMIPDDHPAFVRYPGGLITGDTPLAGRHLHLSMIPADHIVIGPGGPTAAPVAGAESGGLPGAATPTATPAATVTAPQAAAATVRNSPVGRVRRTTPAATPAARRTAPAGGGSPVFMAPTPRSSP